jgi:hypothetical protein
MADKKGAISVTPIDSSLIGRVKAGIRAAAGEWFSAGKPLPEMAPQEEPRGLDYRTFINTGLKPRDQELVSFDDMRALAQNCSILAAVIQTRCDQLTKMKRVFRLKKKPNEKGVDLVKRTAADPRIKELELFFAKPDKEHDWSTWYGALLYDLLVIDAPTIYPRRTRDGKLYSLNLIDGATIKRVIDNMGMTPMPPDAAYQQIIKGAPMRNLTTNDIIYRPRTVRTHKIYGFSHVEKIILTVNVALRREIYMAEYYTEGTTPDVMLRVPDTWTPKQIEDFTAGWELMNSTTADRRKTKFVPNFDPIVMKPEVLKDTADEWLARIICYEFSVPCAPFIKETNRGTANTQKEQSMEEGLLPLMHWTENLVNDIIQSPQYFGYDDIFMDWEDDREEDSLKQAQIDDYQVKTGIKGVDEIRERNGDDPLGVPAGFFTVGGFIPFSTAIEQAQVGLDAAKAGVDAIKNGTAGGEDPPPNDKGKGKNVGKVTTGDLTKKKLY